MRAADLLGRPVTAPDGRLIGKVLDIRVVQDGPLLGAFAALRVDGLVVGRRALASRLGYARAQVAGPVLVAALVRRLMRDNVYLPWSEVAEVGEVVRSRSADLGPVERIT
jgi:sporulation protein YlmC with PRC-barrel domain